MSWLRAAGDPTRRVGGGRLGALSGEEREQALDRLVAAIRRGSYEVGSLAVADAVIGFYDRDEGSVDD